MKKSINFTKAKKLSLQPFFLKKNYLAPQKLNVPYLRYRFLRPILKLYYRSFRWYKGVTPWTSPASITIFDQLLHKDMIGFEWGSGSSTLFFAKRLQKLISIEHHKGWFQKVDSEIKGKGINNVDYIFVDVEYPDQHLDKDGFQVALNQKQTEAYQTYVSTIDGYPDEHFDFVLIDGRARVECGMHAIPKLKPGGLLVLDNSERSRYKPLIEQLKSWESIWTTNGLTDTTIWLKP